MKKGTSNSVKDIVDSSLAGIASALKKGPAERAGKKIDVAVKKTKDALRDIGDDIKKSR